MGKIEKLLDKTKRNGETKKWKIYVFAVIGILVVVGGFFGLYTILFPTLELYDSSNPINQHIKFYNYQENINSSSVYFIGSSVIGTAVYSPLIDSKLSENNLSVVTWNLHQGADTPRIRCVEIDSMISSHPSLIIYGLTYTDITRPGHWEWIETAQNSPLTNKELEIFYTTDEINTARTNSENIFSNKISLIKILPQYLRSIFAGSMYETISTQMKEGYSPGFLKSMGDSYTDKEKIKATANSTYAVLDYNTITAQSNAQALWYNIQKLKDANIPVILISMPINPIVYAAISEDAKTQYHGILNSTGVKWLDLETILDEDSFYDEFHKTWDGCQKFSQCMADLIIQEMT